MGRTYACKRKCGALVPTKGTCCDACATTRLGKTKVDGNFVPTADLTRDQLLRTRPSNGSGRNAIAALARKAYMASGQPLVCKVCGYAKIVDVCHLKGVMECAGTTTIAHINRLVNLVALCKNHHAELDSNLLSEEDRQLISPSKRCGSAAAW